MGNTNNKSCVSLSRRRSVYTPPTNVTFLNNEDLDVSSSYTPRTPRNQGSVSRFVKTPKRNESAGSLCKWNETLETYSTESTPRTERKMPKYFSDVTSVFSRHPLSPRSSPKNSPRSTKCSPRKNAPNVSAFRPVNLSESDDFQDETYQEAWCQNESTFKAENFENLERLKNATKMSNAKLIFDSRVDEIDSRNLNSHIAYKDNIMVVIVTDQNEVFGCFHEEALPNASYEGSQQIVSTKNFFLFTWKNKIFKTYERKENVDKTFNVHSTSTQQFVLSVFSAFWVLKTGEVYVHQNIKENYKIKTTSNNPFFESSAKPNAQLKHLFVLQWE
ncbi:hypothetical protein EIN_341330 [Entamoeba invadens IP1]|uniref:TLDc domain-containing protein n=1 Tax=Entamoeba invadens IP1 TaxID=370355 RepID=A0A0A1UDS5_ENTIV|nr:hypothetical protein EIN_341330 [Entamoeba invadens IP1]ELP94755.1 hypothetical protein EIN_341330 [Entamoeba invadens IP1]|eukprot:XP_004261526.1 hypothetical protein EIN_341330 [Entamoeba invadens IP1]